MVSGSIRKLILDGIAFNAPGDVNLSEMGGKFENEAVPHTGGNLIKKTLRAEIVEGLVLIVDTNEKGLLREFSERIEPFPMSYVNAAGNTRRSVAGGTINFDTFETEENRATITLIPLSDWTDFA